MERKLMFFWIILVLLVVAAGYVRLAPSDPARWHVPLEFSADRNLKSGVMRVLETGPDGLARLDAIARAAPRTQVVAGTVADGAVTYVTRSKVLGFPDYTTAQQDGTMLRLYARQRFGRSDFGVNRTRLEAWIQALQAGG